jgi:biopolymer transport protein TolR
MMPKGRRRRGTVHTMSEISLTSLIDVLLVILVILIMASTSIIHHAIKVDLPKGQMQEAQGDNQELVIFIDKSEHIFINENKVDQEQLVTALEQKIGMKKDQKVFVNADASIQYGTLMAVVDRIKYLGGVEHVVLSTERA